MFCEDFDSACTLVTQIQAGDGLLDQNIVLRVKIPSAEHILLIGFKLTCLIFHITSFGDLLRG